VSLFLLEPDASYPLVSAVRVALAALVARGGDVRGGT